MYGLLGAVIASGAFVVLWRVVRRMDGRSLSPAGIYIVRWWLLVVLYCINPLGYPELSWKAWLAVVSAVGGFFFGYVIVRAPAKRGGLAAWRETSAPASEPIPRWLWKATKAIFFTGLALYTVYAVHVALTFGPIAAVLGPQQLRSAISNDRVPLGFHYLYFFEMVPALAVLLVRRYVPTARQFRLLVGAGMFAAVTLLGTTARTNTFKALVWASVVYLYTLQPRRLNRRLAVVVGGGVVTLMFLFTAIGNNLGKSYENSAFGAGRVSVPGWFRPLALPYHYNAAELPTLDALIHDPERDWQYGVNTLNPAATVLALVVPGVEVPSHIGRFYSNPYPFNVATQLDVFIRDFGLLGASVGSLMLGLWSGLISRRFFAGWRDPMNLLLMSWLAMILNSSTGAAAFAKVSYVLQLVIILALRRYARRRARATPVVPVHA